ncbi:MAG: hypothetical protein MUP44_05360, partial [Anaerolineales bacterium]|nr:hypothetical protein [Anaerolineales bacterium]
NRRLLLVRSRPAGARLSTTYLPETSSIAYYEGFLGVKKRVQRDFTPVEHNLGGKYLFGEFFWAS